MAPSYCWFALTLPLCGVTSLIMITTANAFVQMSVAAEMRGRVMALYMCIFMGGTPIGAPILGLGRRDVGRPLDAHRRRRPDGDRHDRVDRLAGQPPGRADHPHLRPWPGVSIGHGEAETIAETVVAA